MWLWSLGWKDPLEEEMAIHSSILARRIPWTEESGGLQFMGSQRVGHDWATSRKHTHTHTLQTSAILVTQLLWLLSCCSYLPISFYSSFSLSISVILLPPSFGRLLISTYSFTPGIFCFLPNHLICDFLCVSHIQNPKKRASSRCSQSLALCWVEFSYEATSRDPQPNYGLTVLVFTRLSLSIVLSRVRLCSTVDCSLPASSVCGTL